MRPARPTAYDRVLSNVVELVEAAHDATVRSVNAIMTATYWLVGRCIVEHKQGGRMKAAYGRQVLEKLSAEALLSGLSRYSARASAERASAQRRQRGEIRDAVSEFGGNKIRDAVSEI